MNEKRILTGFQPTGSADLHVGNYCGALYELKKAIKNNSIKEEEVYMFVVDLHAMTTFSQDLTKKSLSMAKCLYALNLGKRVNIYIQSHISATCEGHWLLSMFTTTGEMNRMTQFKDKKELGNSNVGLYTYPILMAADILFLGAQLVSVGEDQQQHLELARVIANRFNTKYQNTFTPPLPFTKTQYRIMNLQDCTKKMSKSSPEGCLFLQDSSEVIRYKISKAQTDKDLFPMNLENLYERPAAHNLANLYGVFAEMELEEVIHIYQNQSWKYFKEELIKVITKFCETFQENYKHICDEDLHMRLRHKALEVNKIFNTKLGEAYSIFQNNYDK